MYILMKDGKYFTGHIAFGDAASSDLPEEAEQSRMVLDFMAWTRHPGSAKVWEKHRGWAERAAAKWGGEVVEIPSSQH